MSEENAATENQDQPVLSVQKIYTRDISFENPNAPEVFMNSENSPKIELNLGVNNRQINDELWEVSLKVTVLARNSENEEVVFEIEAEQAGLFYIKNVSEEDMPTVLGINCPSIIFPYTRQVISQLTIDGGFVPLMLEPFNFAAAFQQGQEQQQTTH